jgi:type IV pilus assembly protein PilE
MTHYFKSTSSSKDILTARAQAGFTLLELLLVVAVIGILASISVGQYNQHITQSNRRAAVASLYAAQQMMERGRLQNGQYVNLSAEQINSLTDQGQDHAIASALGNNGYTLTATPPANQPDAECGVLSITNSDARTITGTATVNQCWQ